MDTTKESLQEQIFNKDSIEIKGNNNVTTIVHEDQIENYEELVSKLRNLFEEEYTNNEELYLKQDFERIMDKNNDWHCGRYLRHFLMNLDKAFAGMKHTMRWRNEIKMNELTDSHFPKELWLYSPFFCCGKSTDGCIMFYLNGAHYKRVPDVIKPLVRNFFYYYLETLEIANPNGEKIYLVFNETDSSLANFEIDTIKWLVSIRDNWPDRIKNVFVVGLPFFLRPIVRMILTWLPIEWREIIKIGTMEQIIFANVDNEESPWLLGGQIDPSCRLAPVDSKWAADIEFFKDPVMLDKLHSTIGFHLTEEQREHFEELQSEHDKLYVR